jgi:hypothetical protein
MWREILRKKCFLKRNEIFFKRKWTVFVFLKLIKGFPFFSLRSENKFVEAKRKIRSKRREKKRKNITEFFKWTRETHANPKKFSFISLIKEKTFLAWRAYPTEGWEGRGEEPNYMTAWMPGPLYISFNTLCPTPRLMDGYDRVHLRSRYFSTGKRSNGILLLCWRFFFISMLPNQTTKVLSVVRCSVTKQNFSLGFSKQNCV